VSIEFTGKDLEIYSNIQNANLVKLILVREKAVESRIAIAWLKFPKLLKGSCLDNPHSNRKIPNLV